MEDNKTVVSELKKIVKNIVDEREWGQFHNPKNLSCQYQLNPLS